MQRENTHTLLICTNIVDSSLGIVTSYRVSAIKESFSREVSVQKRKKEITNGL